jgi:hypothetical protein
MSKMTTESFIIRANEVHGISKYDYSKVVYVNSSTKITIICEANHVFEQTPHNHLTGKGCFKCSGRYKKTTDEFIIEANNKFLCRFDYSLVDYKNNHTEIKIICKDHGQFVMTGKSHLKSKNGCVLCGIKVIKEKRTSCTEEFIKKAINIFGNVYDYNAVEYINSTSKIKIICKDHGEFIIKAACHLHNKRGCPKCVFKKQYSKSSINWLNFISKLYNIEIQHGENIGEFRIPNTTKRADGYCKENNTIYEFHGDYWHGNPKKFIHSEINKISKCTFGELYQRTLDREQQIRDLGYNLITIWENDWKKLNRCVKILQRKYRMSKLR